MKQICDRLPRFLNGICKHGFLLFLLYKILIDWISLSMISVHYAYASGGASPNITKYVLAWLVYLCLVILFYQIRNESIKFAYGFFLIISAAPSLMIYWLKNESTEAFLGITIFWLVAAVFSIIISRTIPGTDYLKRETTEWIMPQYNNPIILGIFVFLIISTIYFSYKYSGFRLFIRFEDVYNYRMDTSNYMSSIESYIYSWNTNVLLPICLIVHLKGKKISLLAIDVLIGLASYAIYGNKIIVFQIAYVIGVWMADVLQLKKRIIEAASLVFTLLALLGIIVKESTIGSFIMFFLYRLLYIPAEAHYFYFDFFRDAEKLYLRQSILRRFFSNPYSDTVSILIGTKYNNLGNYNNLNNGLFSDAYANFGIIGLMVYPIIIIIIILVISKVMRRYDSSFKNALMITFLINMVSTPLMQNFLTGGLMVAICLIIMLNDTCPIRIPFRHKFERV